MPFELPDEQSFDLFPAKREGEKGGARMKLGRVGFARELKAPFLERIEFPDQWVLADECGLDHDGWQGPGILELEVCDRASPRQPARSRAPPREACRR